MEIVRILYDLVAETVGWTTGRILVGLLSCGRVRVRSPLDAEEEGFGWHGFRRGAGGRPEMSAQAAELAGVLFWVAFAVGAVAVFGRL